MSATQQRHSKCFFRCNRWSVFTPFIFYTVLLLLAFAAPISLRSSPLRTYDEATVLGHNRLDTPPQPPPLGQEADPRRSQEILEDVFGRADRDSDGRLTLSELSDWINSRVQEHIDSALRENVVLFTAVDTDPRDGTVSWDEYHRYFLRQRGLSQEYAHQHSEKHRELERSVKETIMRDRASWSEAARSDPDRLTLDEFLAFRHPESSHATILSLVDELFDKFDRDGDELLTEEEFSSLPQPGAAGAGGGGAIEEQRRAEFRQLVDRDGNGHADRQELLMYMDPRNPRHARQEASQLLQLADADADGTLELSEVLAHAGPFLTSKMVDTAAAFHDEF